MEKDDCFNLIQCEDGDHVDLISTCSSFVVFDDERNEECDVDALDYIDLSNSLLFEDNLLQDSSTQRDSSPPPYLYIDKDSQSFSDVRNLPKLMQNKKVHDKS